MFPFSEWYLNYNVSTFATSWPLCSRLMVRRNQKEVKGLSHTTPMAARISFAKAISRPPNRHKLW